MMMMMSLVRRMIAGLVRMILIGYGVPVSNLITTGQFKLGLYYFGNPALSGDYVFPVKVNPLSLEQLNRANQIFVVLHIKFLGWTVKGFIGFDRTCK